MRILKISNKTTKLILLITCVVSTFFMFGFTKEPEKLLQTFQSSYTQLNTIIQLIDENKYEQAIDLMQQTTDIDHQLIYYNKSKFTDLITNFKKILINNTNNLLNKNDFTTAKLLLTKYIKYYESDNQIQQFLLKCDAELKKNSLVEYNGVVKILIFNPLISFPEIFLNNTIHAESLDINHITISEFEKILLSAYNNNYILVDINLVHQTTLNSTTPKPLLLPKGKKPLILGMIDKINNYKDKGVIDKIILDRNNEIATYTSKKSIHERVSYNNDFITILEEFVKQNPTFSHNNAKGFIISNSTSGILGYKTQKSNATSKYEIKKATQISNILKDNGWRFAIGDINDFNILNELQFSKEITKIKNEVENIIGSVYIYCYTDDFYEENYNIANLSFRERLLIENGINVFLVNSNNNNNNNNNNNSNSNDNYNIGNTSNISSISNASNVTNNNNYYNSNNDTNNVSTNTENIIDNNLNYTVFEFILVTGQNLRNNKAEYNDVFEPEIVYDYMHRNKIFNF